MGHNTWWFCSSNPTFDLELQELEETTWKKTTAAVVPNDAGTSFFGGRSHTLKHHKVTPHRNLCFYTANLSYEKDKYPKKHGISKLLGTGDPKEPHAKKKQNFKINPLCCRVQWFLGLKEKTFENKNPNLFSLHHTRPRSFQVGVSVSISNSHTNTEMKCTLKCRWKLYPVSTVPNSPWIPLGGKCCQVMSDPPSKCNASKTPWVTWERVNPWDGGP